MTDDPIGSAVARAAKARRGLFEPLKLPVQWTYKQSLFLGLDVLEALYGGSAGAGKSWVLLGAALQYVHVSGYSALLLRRRYADLEMPGGLVPTSVDWIGDKARFNRERMQWTFPSGATLTFGYLDHDSHLDRYQGAQLAFVGFDELTQFPEHHYRYLFSRLRKPDGAPYPLRMRAASNPGGLGHEWVKRRFLEEGEVI